MILYVLAGGQHQLAMMITYMCCSERASEMLWIGTCNIASSGMYIC